MHSIVSKEYACKSQFKCLVWTQHKTAYMATVSNEEQFYSLLLDIKVKKKTLLSTSTVTPIQQLIGYSFHI